MKKFTKCLIACTVCKLWMLGNALLISWLNFTFTTGVVHHARMNMAQSYDYEDWSNWWAGPVAWSAAFGIAAAVFFTIVACAIMEDDK